MRPGIDVFKQYLGTCKLKLTRERRLIAEEVLQSEGHFDMEELYVRMRARGVKVSRASAYRTLPLLVKSGLIVEVERTDKHLHYERVAGRVHHDHMLCMNCGQVMEFYSAALERLQEKICTERNFKSASHILEIKGHCKKCA